MRRSSQKKSSSSSAAANAGSTKASAKEFEKIDQLFNVYADKSSGTIEKMKAQNQGFLTLEEWRTGLKALRVDSINKLKKALPELVKEVSRPTDFVDFYSYAFRYCLIEDKQKCIDIESACQLLNLVLGSKFRPQVDKFTEYLQVNFVLLYIGMWPASGLIFQTKNTK